MEVAYRCHRCGKIVFEYQILYGSHRCRKCGSRKVEPIIQDLTWFGKWYCEKRNKFAKLYYSKRA
jgi:hypothetical protein